MQLLYGWNQIFVIDAIIVQNVDEMESYVI
jgi:hypothetical protein